MASARVKAVIIGDWACGKTSLVTCLVSGEFSNLHLATVFDNILCDVAIDGKTVIFCKWSDWTIEIMSVALHFRLNWLCGTHQDKKATTTYALWVIRTPMLSFCASLWIRQLHFRMFWISGSQKWVVIKYFCIFSSAASSYLTKASRYCPNVPIILLGNKKDLSNSMQKQISHAEGVAMGKKISAFAYLECSAKSDVGVEETFEVATRAALHARSFSSAFGHCSFNKKCCRISWILEKLERLIYWLYFRHSHLQIIKPELNFRRQIFSLNYENPQGIVADNWCWPNNEGESCVSEAAKMIGNCNHSRESYLRVNWIIFLYCSLCNPTTSGNKIFMQKRSFVQFLWDWNRLKFIAGSDLYSER